jgi:hypothetical protein
VTKPVRRTAVAGASWRVPAAIVVTVLVAALPAGTVRAQHAPAPPPAATRPVPATPGDLSREEKRCAAGVRRVERHKEKLAETQRTIEAHRKTIENCGDPRACERAAYRGRTLATRESNEARQLGRLEAEARVLCDAATAAARPTQPR